MEISAAENERWVIGVAEINGAVSIRGGEIQVSQGCEFETPPLKYTFHLGQD
jgi:hypothetical protein